jgi:peptide methionine sulfoxide reductase MsrA
MSNKERDQDMQQALFGGGCFWCTEAVFLQIQGVIKVVSGYAGGDIPTLATKLCVRGKPSMQK